jgi:hypothetical protein
MRSQLSSLALLLTLPTVACVDPSGDPPDTQDVQDVSNALEQANGGFDAADEAPAFGAELELSAAAIEADAAITDELAVDPVIASADRAGLHLIVVWGKLPAERDAEEVRDWTGSLTLSRGAMAVRRTIGFEDRTDRLLPRTSRASVSFESQTRPYIDGLALTVDDPMPAAAETLTLTYTPAGRNASHTLDLSLLAGGPIVIDAGGGFKIVAVAHRRQIDPCDRGFMRGRWRALAPNVGSFLGVVTNEDGERVGHVRGIYGQRRTGEPVLFGKFVNREGQFRGVLTGTYGNGAYRARWIDGDGGDHGTAHGVYFASETERGGGFLGRWAETSCTPDRAPPRPAPPTR